MDVTFSGCVYVTARDEDQAKEKALWINFVPSELDRNHFYFLGSDVVEVNEAED